MNIIIQLLDTGAIRTVCRSRPRRRSPGASGVTDKTIQTNIRQLEIAGLIRREQRKTASGDWNSNIYHLNGLVERIRQLEPDFTKARETRREATRRAETPVGRRKA